MNGERRTSNVEHRTTHDAVRTTRDEKGFSLTEVLLSVGTLAIGMLFIAGVFPVAIHFATLTTERTLAATIADEAFAKVKLIATDPLVPIDPCDFAYIDFAPFEPLVSRKRDIAFPPIDGLPQLNILEFAYPSTVSDPDRKRYWWSAICRRQAPSQVQVTIFISRKTGAAKKYWARDVLNLADPLRLITIPRPVPVELPVTAVLGGALDRIAVNDAYLADTINETLFINAGSTIVDNATGQIYRVLERLDPPNANVIQLDRQWQGTPSGSVWVVPPPAPAGHGRSPCIAVYQKSIRL